MPEHQILRLHIDGLWTAAEMAAEFSALDYLYNVASIIDPLLSLPGGMHRLHPKYPPVDPRIDSLS